MLQTIRRAAAAVALAFAVSACQPVITGNAEVDAILAQAASIAKTTCGVTVIAAQIVTIVPDARLITASQIATALCAAVLKARKRGISSPALRVPVRIRGNVVHVTVQQYI